MIPRLIRRWLIARGIRRQLLGGARREIMRDREAVSDEAGTFVINRIVSVGPAGPVGNLLWTGNHVAEPAKPAPAPAAKWRQHIAMPGSNNMFAPPWIMMQPGAHEAAWEDLHTFPKGERPTRDSVGVHGGSPIAFVCPGCDLAQPPMTEEHRSCGYCGLKVRRVSMRLYWWREPTEVQEWKP